MRFGETLLIPGLPRLPVSVAVPGTNELDPAAFVEVMDIEGESQAAILAVNSRKNSFLQNKANAKKTAIK